MSIGSSYDSTPTKTPVPGAYASTPGGSTNLPAAPNDLWTATPGALSGFMGAGGLLNQMMGPWAGMGGMPPLDMLMQMMQADQQRGAMGANAGYERAQIGLERKGLGVDTAAARRQLPLLKQLYQLEMGTLARGEQTAKYGAGRARQEQTGEAASRGALTTPGEARRVGDISHQLADQLAGIGERRRKDTLGYSEDVRGVKDQLAKLGLKGKELDLRASHIASSLQRGLSALGLNKWLSVADLMNKQLQGQMGQLGMVGGLIQMILQAGMQQPGGK